MFQFPGFASRINQDDCRQAIGLPHSDIPGSKLVYQLPEAFRRYPRPSSPVSAKASTVCPYSLDHISPSIHLEVCHRQDDKHGLPFLNCQRTIPLPYCESVVLSFFIQKLTTTDSLITFLLSTSCYLLPVTRFLPPTSPPQRPTRCARASSLWWS